MAMNVRKTFRERNITGDKKIHYIKMTVLSRTYITKHPWPNVALQDKTTTDEAPWRHRQIYSCNFQLQHTSLNRV